MTRSLLPFSFHREVYPVVFGSSTLEGYLAQTSPAGRPIYLGVLVALIALFASLPFMLVDVSVQADGLVRPVVEKSEARVPVSGKIWTVQVLEHQSVKQGDVLASLATNVIDEEALNAANSLRQAHVDVHDLRLLALGNATGIVEKAGIVEKTGTVPLATLRYQRELAQYEAEREAAVLRQRGAQRELERAEMLHAKNFATDSAVEQHRHEVAREMAAARLLAQQYRSRWEAALAQRLPEEREAELRVSQLEEQRALHVVTAPVTGTIEQVMSVARGSFVQAGEAFAIISPSSRLVVELVVTPRDVGLLRVGTPVRIHVDAYRSTDWGVLTGRVAELADDFTLANQMPMFRVRCSIDREQLQLRNGAVGRLRKGMTVRAQFLIGRRSIYHLLWDKLSDWFDPAFGKSTT